MELTTSKESETNVSKICDPKDGIHMKLLRTALKKTTSKCVSSFKISMLKREFAPVYKKDPKAIHQLHEGATTQLRLNIEEEVEKMFEEENIAKFMSKLDELKDKSDCIDKDIVAWRPSGDPSVDVLPHVQPTHAQHLQQLQKIFDQLQSQNTVLQRHLQKQQSRLLQSQQAIQDHLNVWKRANILTAEECKEMETFKNSRDSDTVNG